MSGPWGRGCGHRSSSRRTPRTRMTLVASSLHVPLPTEAGCDGAAMGLRSFEGASCTVPRTPRGPRGQQDWVRGPPASRAAPSSRRFFSWVSCPPSAWNLTHPGAHALRVHLSPPPPRRPTAPPPSCRFLDGRAVSCPPRRAAPGPRRFSGSLPGCRMSTRTSCFWAPPHFLCLALSCSPFIFLRTGL